MGGGVAILPSSARDLRGPGNPHHPPGTRPQRTRAPRARGSARLGSASLGCARLFAWPPARGLQCLGGFRARFWRCLWVSDLFLFSGPARRLLCLFTSSLSGNNGPGAGMSPAHLLRNVPGRTCCGPQAPAAWCRPRRPPRLRVASRGVPPHNPDSPPGVP